MEVLNGIDAVLFFKKNETWVPFGCAETAEVVVTTETVSVKTIGDGMWDTTRAQKHAYTVTCSGIVQYDDEDNRENHFDLLAYQIQGVHIEWYMSFKQNDKTTEYTQLGGFALVVNTNINAPNDFVNSSVELKGKGELRIGAPPSCAAEITDYDVVRGLFFNYTVTINSSTGSPTGYDYRIDGGATENRLSNTWTFSVAGLGTSGGYGAHVLEIWPVCDNGIQGTVTTYEFVTTL